MDKGLILIVEDDPDIMQILDAYLIRDGYRTVRAGDGETAMTHFSMLRPDLILLDIGLPKLDGIDVLTRIRRERDTPIIMVTALAEDMDKLTGLRLGADDYIVKPFNPQEMVARVNAVLKRSRQPTGGGILRFGAIEIDTEAYIAAVCSDAGQARSAVDAQRIQNSCPYDASPHLCLSAGRSSGCLPAGKRCAGTHGRYAHRQSA